MAKEIKRVLFSAGTGMLTILAMTGGFAYLVLKETIDMTHLDLMTAGILIMGSASAAMCCGKGEGSPGRVAAAEATVILCLCLINLAVYDGMFFESLFPCVLLIGGTGAAVVLMRAGKAETGRRKKRNIKRGIGKLNKKYIR